MLFCLRQIVWMCLLFGYGTSVVGADDSGKPAAPVELADFQEVAGILAWSFRLPEGVGDYEYARLEWNISLEDGPGRVEPGGVGFPELRSNDEIKLFLWIDELNERPASDVRSIPYCVKTRSANGVWEKRNGDLHLPEGIWELHGFERSGPSDLNWFLMLISAENDKDAAFLNLGYAPRQHH